MIGEPDPLVPASLGRRLSELSNTSRISETFAASAAHIVRSNTVCEMPAAKAPAL
jgi:hypothetical protein